MNECPNTSFDDWKKLFDEIQSNDSDIFCSEVKLSLACPLSFQKIEIPARGLHCKHLVCFDLKGYLKFQMISGDWKCPVCSKSCKLSELVIDSTLLNVIRMSGISEFVIIDHKGELKSVVPRFH